MDSGGGCLDLPLASCVTLSKKLAEVGLHGKQTLRWRLAAGGLLWRVLGNMPSEGMEEGRSGVR